MTVSSKLAALGHKLGATGGNTQDGATGSEDASGQALDTARNGDGGGPQFAHVAHGIVGVGPGNAWGEGGDGNQPGQVASHHTHAPADAHAHAHARGHSHSNSNSGYGQGQAAAAAAAGRAPHAQAQRQGHYASGSTASTTSASASAQQQHPASGPSFTSFKGLSQDFSQSLRFDGASTSSGASAGTTGAAGPAGGAGGAAGGARIVANGAGPVSGAGAGAGAGVGVGGPSAYPEFSNLSADSDFLREKPFASFQFGPSPPPPGEGDTPPPGGGAGAAGRSHASKPSGSGAGGAYGSVNGAAAAAAAAAGGAGAGAGGAAGGASHVARLEAAAAEAELQQHQLRSGRAGPGSMPPSSSADLYSTPAASAAAAAATPGSFAFPSSSASYTSSGRPLDAGAHMDDGEAVPRGGSREGGGPPGASARPRPNSFFGVDEGAPLPAAAAGGGTTPGMFTPDTGSGYVSALDHESYRTPPRGVAPAGSNATGGAGDASVNVNGADGRRSSFFGADQHIVGGSGNNNNGGALAAGGAASTGPSGSSTSSGSINGLVDMGGPVPGAEQLRDGQTQAARIAAYHRGETLRSMAGGEGGLAGVNGAGPSAGGIVAPGITRTMPPPINTNVNLASLAAESGSSNNSAAANGLGPGGYLGAAAPITTGQMGGMAGNRPDSIAPSTTAGNLSSTSGGGALLDHSHLRPGQQAALLSHGQTLELYRQNAKKTNDPDLIYEFAVFMIDASKTMGLEEVGTGANAAGGGGVAARLISGPSPARDKQEAAKEDLVKEAMGLLKKIADRGHADAQYFLADCYANGIGTSSGKQSFDKAYPLFVLAAKHGHPDAAYRAGTCTEKGWGCRKDSGKALQFYRKAASQGHPGSMYRLATAELNGELGLKKSAKEGVKWLKRSAEAATPEFPHALHELALLHERGVDNVVFVDHDYSCELLAQSAEMGYAPSAYKLGVNYEYGRMGCPQDGGLSIHMYNIGELLSQLLLTYFLQ